MTEFKGNTSFRVGDKVRCVEGLPEIHGTIRTQGIYTVSHVNESNYIGLEELGDQRPEWLSSRFVLHSRGEGSTHNEVVLEDTPMTETEKAVYHLQSLLHINNATIVITAEGLEVLRAEQDESYNPEVWSLDELLKALDVIEPYNN